MTADRTAALLDRITYTPPTAQRTALQPIPWPDGLVPTWVEQDVNTYDPLPDADVLIVTYTAAEGEALADVLTPGHGSSTWTQYRNGWTQLRRLIEGHRAPSLYTDCAGIWACITIGQVKVVLVKSDLHPATDGAKLPMAALWKQMLEQVRPSLVLTTGTAGGVGEETLLGDVIVSRHVRWDCEDAFAHADFAHSTFVAPSGPVDQAMVDLVVTHLIGVNGGNLPAAPRAPRVLIDDTSAPLCTITTDFFAFDDAEDHYGLRTYEPDARAVEMDDAALGVALGLDGTHLPAQWFSVRNASDPQIPQGSSIEAEDKQAGSIYERYGYWTTVNSALTCWALVTGHDPSS